MILTHIFAGKDDFSEAFIWKWAGGIAILSSGAAGLGILLQGIKITSECCS
jgi:hypothetical protein